MGASTSMESTTPDITVDAMAAAESDLDVGDGDWQFVGMVDDFIERGTIVDIKLEGGTVAIFKKNGKLYAIDKFCYHSGGPLEQGDIEDLGDGKICVKCPWHNYQISLETGEGFYQGMAGEWKSKGVKQRVHELKLSGLRVLIRVDRSGRRSDGKEIESDRYATLAVDMPVPAGSRSMKKLAAGDESSDVVRGPKYPMHSKKF